MSALSDIVAKFRAASPNIAAAFDEVERRLVALEGTPPPPSNKLKWAPPALTSPSTVNVSSPGTYNLTGDSVVNLNLSFSGRNRITLAGGRHIRIIGGQIDYANTANDDGDSSLQIEGGDPNGIVHIEGLRITNLPNGITLKTPRLVRVQNCHIKVGIFQNNFGLGHPDVIQVWRGFKSAGIQVHRLTAHSPFTFLCDFTDEPGVVIGSQTPAFWELHDVDMHGPTALNNWMGSPAHAVWKGSNCWLETSTTDSGQRRDLGDQLRQFGEQYSPKHAGYQILDPAGAVLYTQQPGVASGAPGTIGTVQGHVLRYLQSAHPNLTLEWRCQLPPGGEFVPASSVGAGYVSPGYA